MAMTESPPDSLIPYDEIVQEALRAVVGRVLTQVATEGLPGNHHFYITFKTRAPGVSIPRSLSERFPDEMTIVLQNKYWDLKVTDTGFEVGLTFSQVPAHLSRCSFRPIWTMRRFASRSPLKMIGRSLRRSKTVQMS